MTLNFLLVPFLALLALVTPASAEGLMVTIEGIRNSKGNIVILVFDKAHAFDSLDVWSAIDYAQVPSRKGSVAYAFTNLQAGPYAVLSFHDENKDEDLNMTATQLLEGVGSTGAPNPQDEPDFQAASVWPGEVRIRIHYDQ